MKRRLVLNAFVLIMSFLGLFILGCVGINGEQPVALAGAFVCGGIGIADAICFWDRVIN